MSSAHYIRSEPRYKLRLAKTASLGSPTMNKIALVILASVALMSVGACAGVGKGKGKAPPPYTSPVITKG